MSYLSVDEMKDVSLPARFRRQRRIIIPIAVAVLAAGAFLQWGPIGLGNGPLRMGSNGDTWSQPRPVRVGDILPVSYAGSGTVTIDSVTLVNRTSYPTPRLIAAELLLLAPENCATFAPAQAAAHGFDLPGCGGQYLGPLAGQTVGQPKNAALSYSAGLEMTPPKAGGCWVLSYVVVHYHTGIRHYSAAEPNGTVVCAGKDASANVDAVSQATNAGSERELAAQLAARPAIP